MTKADFPSNAEPLQRESSLALEEIAENYLEQIRAGKSTDIEAWVIRFPRLEKEIRDTLPALAAMEQLGIELEGSPASAPRWTAPQVEQVGDYRILGELGRGGMGIVYEAEQQSLGRRVALKVLPKVTSDEIGLARFQREARAAARLHHSNIVPVFQVGQDDGHAYYAMQLIEGRGLDAVIKDLRQLPREEVDASQRTGRHTTTTVSEGSSGGLHVDRSEVLRGLTIGTSENSDPSSFFRSVAQIGVQASDALAYAHERGIVHRDVKPSNLLLDGSGVVWVSDFGLAMTDEGQLTHTEDVLGTIRYMSPERFQHQCDARADIYALGITLYELLVMEPAFQMINRLNLIKSIMNDDPPTPRKFDSRVPLDLETIILKAIEKEPRDRYQSSTAMAEDLRRFLNDDPIEARRIRPIEKLLRWRRRNKSLATALLTITMLLVTLLGLLSWTSFRQNELRQLAEQRGDALLKNLYFSQMNVAGQAAKQRFGVHTTAAQLAEWIPAGSSQDFRNWEWYYLYGLSHSEEYVSEPLGNEFCWACDHSPDGKKLVNTKNAWGIQIRDAKTGAILAEKELGSSRFVDWSPDGTKIAVGGFSDVCFVVDAETLELVCELSVPGCEEGWCVRWHPNSKWLAEVGENFDQEKKQEIRIHDVESGQQLFALRRPELAPRVLSWNDDGSKLAASGYGKTGIWSFTANKPIFEQVLDGDGATWSPNGAMLAVKRAGGVWDALSNRVLTTSHGSIAWAPDSQQLAIGGADGVIRLFQLERANSHPQRILRGHQSEIWSLSWQPDGQHLASCGLRDETVRIWKVDESNHLEFFGLERRIYVPDISLDGTRIVSSAQYCNAVRVWDVNGNNLATKRFQVNIEQAVPDADGTTIAVCGARPLSTLCLWNTQTDSLKEISTGRHFRGLDWNQQGQLAGISESGNVIIWDADGEIIHNIEGAHQGGQSVHWTPDGERIASSGDEASIKVWDRRSGRMVWQVENLSSRAAAVRFSHDGTRIATSHQNALMIWNALSGDRLSKFEQFRENFAAVDWSADDSRIVSGSASSLAIWDVDSGQVALRLDAPNRFTKVRWSADGNRIIAGGERIQIYNASRGYALNPSEH